MSYNQKHNEANGEDNRDGEDHNLSYNGGEEGPSEDESVLRDRETRKRTFLATLLALTRHADDLRGRRTLPY